MCIVIYGLVDPRTEKIRYVGKSRNVNKRYNAHLYESKNTSTHKECWIANLLSNELAPELQIIEEVDENTWEERERYWIDHFNIKGNNLTNLTPGGDGSSGYVWTDKQKKGLSESLKEMWDDKSFRDKMSAIHEDPEHRAKLSRNSKKKWKDIDYRKKVTHAIRESRDEAFRKKMSEKISDVWKSPGYREAYLESDARQEYREKMVDIATKRWEDTDYRKRAIASFRKSSHTKLTKEKVKKIRELNAKGHTYDKLAEMFNVHRSTIGRAVRHETWKDID